MQGEQPSLSWESSGIWKGTGAGVQPCTLLPPRHPAEETRGAAGWGLGAPHTSSGCWLGGIPWVPTVPCSTGAARRWSGARDEPRDFPGPAVAGGGKPGTESL